MSIVTEEPIKPIATKVGKTKTSKAQKENEMIVELTKKRLASMTDEEIMEDNLKTLLELKSRDERKANGRLIAILVAFLLIFLAVYHAWIRKTAVLAGVLIPALIMLGYGGWVVVLAKRDKKNRAKIEKHVEEVARKNKAEFKEKALKKQLKSAKTELHYENEKGEKQIRVENTPSCISQVVTVDVEHNFRKQKGCNDITLFKDNKRRPSIRQKLFRQKGTENLFANPQLAAELQKTITAHEKRKKLQRMDTLPMPQIVRMSSAPY